MKYEQLLEKLNANIEKIKELDAQEEMTDEIKAEIDSLVIANQKLQAKMDIQKKITEAEGYAEAAKANMPVENRVVPVEPISAVESKGLTIPANVKRWGSNLKSFKGQDADLSAYKAGKWFMAIRGNAAAQRWCAEHGMPVNFIQDGQTEGSNTGGGYLVYDELDRNIIDLKVQYGVFRKNANVTPMTSDVLNKPRRTGGLTAYFTGESAAGTKSTKAWDKVSLTAKKLTVLAKMSSELSEDAIISIADDLVNEIAYAFAYKEDLCGFIGDGTLSTYGGIVGVSKALQTAAGTPTTTSAGGVIVGTGNLFSELVIGDFSNVIGKLPSYARAGAKWFCSPYFYDTVMVRLLNALGGNTIIDLANGNPTPKYMGYPVEFVEVMPSTDANSQIVCLFGNLNQAALFGDRRQTTIAFSEHAVVDDVSVFETDEVAVRGTERFDITVHSVGSTTAAGAIVGLQSLNT